MTRRYDREAGERASERAYCEEILRLRASFIGVCEEVERIHYAYWENVARAVTLETILARLRPGTDPWPYAEIEAALSGSAGRALLRLVERTRKDREKMTEKTLQAILKSGKEALKP